MYDPISREQQLHVEDLTLADVAAFLEGAEEIAGLIVDGANADGTDLVVVLEDAHDAPRPLRLRVLQGCSVNQIAAVPPLNRPGHAAAAQRYPIACTTSAHVLDAEGQHTSAEACATSAPTWPQLPSGRPRCACARSCPAPRPAGPTPATAAGPSATTPRPSSRPTPRSARPTPTPQGSDEHPGHRGLPAALALRPRPGNHAHRPPGSRPSSPARPARAGRLHEGRRRGERHPRRSGEPTRRRQATNRDQAGCRRP